MKALILAGGYGKRLWPLTRSIPKCLLPINNKPIIEYQLELLRGCSEIIIATNYLEDKIRDYLKEHGHNNVRINSEKEPLGTGGAILNARDMLGDEFLVLNGDIITDCDVGKMAAIGKKHGAFAIMAHKKDNVSRYGLLKIGKGCRIEQFMEKSPITQGGWINAGVYYFTDELFSSIQKKGFTSLEKDVFPNLASEKTLFAYRYKGDWFDVGTREDFINANISLSKSSNVFGDKCHIENSMIRNSVMLDNVHITDSFVSDSIIGPKKDIQNEKIIEKII